jgi:hypothetical protein
VQELKEVDDDRDAALPPSGALASEYKDPVAGRVDDLKRLPDNVGPPAPVLLPERDQLWEAPEMLGYVGVRLPVTPMELDLRVDEFRNGFTGQFTP